MFFVAGGSKVVGKGEGCIFELFFGKEEDVFGREGRREEEGGRAWWVYFTRPAGWAELGSQPKRKKGTKHGEPQDTTARNPPPPPKRGSIPTEDQEG